MGLETRFSPRQLALLSIAAGYFVYLVVVSSAVTDRLLPARTAGRIEASLPALLALSLGAGLWAMYAAKGALERGFINDRWPDSALDEVRQLLHSRQVMYAGTASWLIGITWIFLDVLARHGHRAHVPPVGSFAYFLVAPVLARGEILKVLNPRRSEPANRLWTENMKPLTSDRWGE